MNKYTLILSNEQFNLLSEHLQGHETPESKELVEVFINCASFKEEGSTNRFDFTL